MTVVLRRVKKEDSSSLFQWVNRPDALANKLVTQAPIAQATHEAWFAERLADDETFFWIVESAAVAAGQIRMTKKGDAYEVDIYIVPESRATGVASAALKLAVDALVAARPGMHTVRAMVKLGNNASLRLFERAGFRLISTDSRRHILDLKTAQVEC